MAESTVAPAQVETRIQSLRGVQVLLDSDLAAIYGVTTAALNQAVRRNEARFPANFRFQLSPEEGGGLKSQSVTSNSRRGGRRKRPWAFTEHGAIMAASVLSSPRAVEMSVFVVRAFVQLRDFARTHAELGNQLATLERRVIAHDADLKQVFSTSAASSSRPNNLIGRSASKPSTSPEASSILVPVPNFPWQKDVDLY